jgi:uncharacterized protein (TIGR04255 family)
MSPETYRNAPIAEAALDIRVRIPTEVDLGTLESVKDARYPSARTRPFKIEFKVTAANEPHADLKGEFANTALGFAYTSQDLKQVFQVRTDGFTHNRLAPYIDWNSFSSEARRLWLKYSAVARPDFIELLGLNYVNEIHFAPGEPFDKYFRTYIEVPSDLPQSVNTYNLGFQLSWPNEEGVVAFVGQALGQPKKEGFATMVLNIQAFKKLDRPTAEVGEEGIWDTLNRLRDVKNAVFEACITDQVRLEIR